MNSKKEQCKNNIERKLEKIKPRPINIEIIPKQDKINAKLR